MIDLQTLIAAGVAPTQARLFAPHLQPACARFSINTPARMAGFLAQCHVESAGFTALEEGLFYRDAARIMRIFPSSVKSIEQARTLAGNPKALANTVYANRLGNGPPSSGDGWAYRGRGLKQLTGRTNYAAASKGIGRPYVKNPDLVANPEDASLTAAWFWHENGCNELADRQLWDNITRKVNGPGMLQAEQRRRLSVRMLAALS